MISPLIISLKNGLYLDLRADNTIQVFDGLPFDDRYCNDVALQKSEQNGNEMIGLKNKFVSKLLVDDKDLADMSKNIQLVTDCGSDCVLRCIVFCEQKPFLETVDLVQQCIHRINDIRGRNYGGIIFFIVSKQILNHLDTIAHINSEIEMDWEYNHITPALLVTHEKEVRRSSETLHWLRFRSCTELVNVIYFYANMDTIIDLTEILNTDSVTDISETLYKIRMSDGYSRTRLYPFSLHKLLFEPNSIHHCSCSSRAISRYVKGCMRNGCLVSCEYQCSSKCEECGIAHLCGKCGLAFRENKCIFRELTEKYYSLLTQQEIRLC